MYIFQYTPITILTFKAILKELVSSVIGNRKIFCPKPHSALRNVSQPSTSGARPIAMPVMTAVTSTSLPQLCPNILHLLSVQEVPHSQLNQVEVLPKPDIKLLGLRLIDLPLVRL